MPSADPHGHHDWHSQDYVDQWIATDATRDEQRKPVLQKVAALITSLPETAIPVLDVGAGYGALSEQVLKRFPNARLVCQDYSEPMFGHARERLAWAADRVTYVHGDLLTPDWIAELDGPFDAVVSAIAIHNVRSSERIHAVYQEITTVLAPGGCFLNCDLVFADQPASLEVQLGWLRDAGLERVSCFWEQGRSVIIGGCRAG